MTLYTIHSDSRHFDVADPETAEEYSEMGFRVTARSGSE